MGSNTLEAEGSSKGYQKNKSMSLHAQSSGSPPWKLNSVLIKKPDLIDVQTGPYKTLSTAIVTMLHNLEQCLYITSNNSFLHENEINKI